MGKIALISLFLLEGKSMQCEDIVQYEQILLSFCVYIIIIIIIIPPTSDEPSEELLQYRNAFQLLCLHLGGGVLLVDTIYSLDVYYSGPSEKCSVIRSTLLEGIGDVVKNFSISQFFRCFKSVFIAQCVPLLNISVAQTKPRKYLLVAEILE